MQKESWRKHRHTWWKYTELIPTSFASRLITPTPSLNTNLEDGSIVNMEELWQDILRHGLKDPIILRAGVLSQSMRVDVGNHRVDVLAEKGIKVIPAICVVAGDCIGEKGNGLHRFPAFGEILFKEVPPGAPKLCRPSEAFMKLKGYCQPFDCRNPFDIRPYLKKLW